MANTNFLSVDELDFISLKNSLKAFLRNDPRFADIDFDASNISMLLDILSYNTYQNAFYLNMIGNEAFLDTALLRDSVVSHAKELNYTPRSKTSARADVYVQLTVSNNQVQSVEIPQFTQFTSQGNNTTYVFSNYDPIVVVRDSSGNFISEPFEIKEGVIITEYFEVNTSLDNQRFILSNKDADISEMRVYVHNSANDLETKTLFSKVENVFGLNSESKVYFVQASSASKYELVFGDNILGYKPLNGNIVSVTYRVCKGEDANGLNIFSAATINGYVSAVGALTASRDGSNEESISSIKYMAPKHYTTQERAITTNDYKVLILERFPQIKSVYVYGGEEISDTPQYGKVYIAVSTQDGTAASLLLKDEIYNYINLRNPISIDPVLVDPQFVYLNVSTTLNVNIKDYQYTLAEIKNSVINSIIAFNDENLETFDNPFRYSKLVKTIDDTIVSIISNDTTVTLLKKYIPAINQIQTITLDFGNPLESINQDYVVTSTNFTYQNNACFLRDDSRGVMKIYQITSRGNIIVNNNAGTVDYEKGIVKIVNLSISDYEGDSIRFTTFPKQKDINPIRNSILSINVSDGINVFTNVVN